jgi:transcriptional regulator with XRE-family HTH domain
MGAVERRTDLAEFLRARRAAVSPAAVGLPGGPRRRTPGLRREELAMLAGVSVTWYTWLEQGRPINVSRDVLDALARTLALTPAEHDHLLALAGPATSTVSEFAVSDAGAPDALMRLLDAMEPQPSYILGPGWQFVAWNRAQSLLFPVLDTLPVEEQNLMWVVFARPEARALIDGWPTEARRMLAEFRADTAARRDDPAVVELVGRLREASPEFATWWADHDVARFRTRLRRFHHPRAGDLVFEFQQLAPTEWPQLRLVCQLAVPGDDSAQRLAAWHQTF